MAKTKAEKVMMRYKQLQAEKQPWLDMYQRIGEFIRIRKQNFTSLHTEGEFLTEGVFDTTAVFALRVMATTLVGLLFPSGGKAVEVDPPSTLKNPSKEVKEYFSWVTNKLRKFMTAPQSGLSVALDEYMLDAGAFGWGGVAIHDDKNNYDVPIKYSNWDPKHTCFAENSFGFVDTEFKEINYNVMDAAREYGQENLSDKAKAAINEGKLDTKVRVLVGITPRDNMESGKVGNKNKQIATYHIDLETGKMLKESGFDEDPVTIGRFSKMSGETLGRGPGLDAYPTVLMANAMSELILRAGEKQLDPPLGILDDGSLGSDYVDTSAGALSVLSYGGRIPNTNPIFPLVTVGEFTHMEKNLAETRNAIHQHFLLDRLLDLNNDTRMTAFETQVRDRIRGDSLSSVFNRQQTEMFDPLTRKSFNVLFARGLLGVDPKNKQIISELQKAGAEVKFIPAEVLKLMETGADTHELRYVSPATRMMEKEKVQSVMTVLETCINSAGVFEDMPLYVKAGVAIKLINAKTGGDEDLLRSVAEVEEIQKANAEAIQKQNEVDATGKLATAERDLATAEQMKR